MANGSRMHSGQGAGKDKAEAPLTPQESRTLSLTNGRSEALKEAATIAVNKIAVAIVHPDERRYQGYEPPKGFLIPTLETEKERRLAGLTTAHETGSPARIIEADQMLVEASPNRVFAVVDFYCVNPDKWPRDKPLPKPDHHLYLEIGEVHNKRYAAFFHSFNTHGEHKTVLDEYVKNILGHQGFTVIRDLTEIIDPTTGQRPFGVHDEKAMELKMRALGRRKSGDGVAAEAKGTDSASA